MARPQMNSVNILNRLSEKVAEKNLPPRSDMKIVDMREIDDLKCNVLLAYDAHLAGVPTLSQLEQFISATFNNRVVAQAQTAQNHESDEAISVCLTMNVASRPVGDASVMRRMATNTYVDDTTNHIWQVVDNGVQKYLIRRTGENIADIVEARMARSSRKEASFTKVRQAAPMLSVGDTVRFYDGTLPLVGKITSINGSEVSISANGKSRSVSKENVFNVVDRSESVVSSDKNLLEDYFTRAWGNADLARELTRKTDRDDNDSSKDTGWSGTTGGK